MHLPTRKPVTPGEILREEFREPLNMTQDELAAHTGVERRRINQIERGKRELTADTALRLSKAFGTTPQFWLLLQLRVDLWIAVAEAGDAYDDIERLSRPVFPRR